MRALIDKLVHYKDKDYQHYSFLKESQYWSQEQLRQYQFDKLCELWEHAVNHVPYYRNIAEKNNLRNLSNWDDFHRIPVLTKRIVRENFKLLQADNIPANRFLPNSTSGSTGSNFHFYSDANSFSFQRALTLRKFDMMGLSYPSCRKLIVWGASFDVKKATETLWDRTKLFLHNSKIISEYDLSEEGMDKIIKMISKYSPDAFQSYPSILMHLAHYIEKNNLNVFIPVVHTGGEKLYVEQREIIEKAFHCKLYDFYGARDMPMVGMSCSESNKIHVFQEQVVFEVLDGDNNVVDNGEGDIVLTDLNNFVMPFIRYQIGDRARICSSSNKCSCGRNLQQIDEILGRKFDILTFTNGKSVGGTFWTLLLRSVPGIMDFQVVQEERDVLRINYIADGILSDQDQQKLIEQIKKYCGNNVVTVFDAITKLPVTKAGKRQFVISKVQ